MFKSGKVSGVNITDSLNLHLTKRQAPISCLNRDTTETISEKQMTERKVFIWIALLQAFLPGNINTYNQVDSSERPRS